MSPTAAQLLARLNAAEPDHPRFIGAPVDISQLTPQELGALWGPMQRARQQREARPTAHALAEAMFDQARRLGRAPVLTRESALEVFQTIPAEALGWAIEALGWLQGEPPTGLAAELHRILGEPAKWAAHRYQAFVITRHLDHAAQAELQRLVREAHAASPLVLQEFDLLPELSAAALQALADDLYGYYWPKDDERQDPALALSDEPAYIEFAQHALHSAARHIDDIHTGHVPYKADAAFPGEAPMVIARAMRVASLRDEPWLGELIGRLMPRVCVAPTAAKTLPSQSLAIALGHSIEGVPTPESVQALREALKLVRHAGVEKKLARNLKPAERALADRPETALRLAATGKPDKRQQALLAACLEAGFCRETELALPDWRSLLADSAGGAPLARTLVWSARGDDGTRRSFMLDKKSLPFGVDGAAIELPEQARIALWHPLHADAGEREAWQAQLSRLRLRQPLRQVFREHYLPEPEAGETDRTDAFAGHALSIRPLIGLARREGWRIDKHDGLVRRFREIRATFCPGSGLYPGLEGAITSSSLVFAAREGRRWRPIAIRDISAIVYSEACRAVDLLVSATGFALEEEPFTHGERHQRLAGLGLGAMAEMRRRALGLVFASQLAEGRMRIEARHVHVGPCAVHLATARVTKGGAPVEVAQPSAGATLAAVPWLPYDEVLLQKICDRVGALLGA